MLTTIKLDNQLSIQADEIDEVHANRKLAAELIAQQLTASQQAPQDNLGFRGIFSQATSP
jgi:ribosomal protein S3